MSSDPNLAGHSSAPTVRYADILFVEDVPDSAGGNPRGRETGT